MMAIGAQSPRRGHGQLHHAGVAAGDAGKAGSDFVKQLLHELMAAQFAVSETTGGHVVANEQE